jgi:hypothetical protein
VIVKKHDCFTVSSFFQIKLNTFKTKGFAIMNPKVRHYLGAFLWKEKSNTIMNLNFTVEEVLRKHRSVNS